MEEILIASSSTDGGIGCWDLQTGKEHIRFQNCISPSHGLVSVGHRIIASSQLQDSPSSGSILYWSWRKPQAEVKSFPADRIKPLLSNSEGSYLFGGSVSGDIYCWEVTSGRLLRKWHAHYRSVTCLVLSDDESLLISGSEDGSVRVWSLFMIFDDVGGGNASHLYVHSLSDHALCVTDLVVGYGGSNSVIVSASEDRTCKVWSLSTGRLLRNIVFPSIIDAIALDPGEDVFYAGGRDGKIYIAALNAITPSNSTFMHIIGTLPEQSKSVTCLTLSSDGVSLISGYEDGLIRIWNMQSHTVVRMLGHAKGPVNNILVLTLPEGYMKSQASLTKRQASSQPLPKALQKIADSKDKKSMGTKVLIGSEVKSCQPVSYIIDQVMNDQINEIQQVGSLGAATMEIERKKQDFKKALRMAQQWKNDFENLHKFCVDEILNGDPSNKENNTSS